METLELRESRSNLAGMLTAVAAEGVGLLDSWQGRAGTAPASSPPGQGSAGAEAAPAPADPAAAGAPEQRALIRAATPEQAAAAQLDDDQAGLWSERSAARAASGARAVERANQARELPVLDRNPRQADRSGRSPQDAAERSPQGRSGHEVAVEEPVKVDPGQYGQEGTGGPPAVGTDTLLQNQHVNLDSDAISDLEAGRIDPRVVTVLNTLSEHNDITVSAMMSDHDQLTSSGYVSNHYYGRALDISVVDGEAVTSANSAAHDVALSLADLPESIRPTEVGSPWDLPGTADFTDAAHQNHLHIAWDDQISRDWQPPGGVEHPHSPAGDGDAGAGPVLVSDRSSGGESDGGGGALAAAPAEPPPPPAPLDFNAQEAQPTPAQVNVQFLDAVPDEATETES
jgi:hypothetical protein